ncbi:MAG: hypothetical protein CMF69_02710 [Magnetovibrio sp.]|nr:hypothetical protein [Magnetovibrio sp.]
MPNFRKFILSHELFSGYSSNVDLDVVESKNDIINFVHNEVHNLLVNNNFDILIKNLKESNFHIHDYEFGDILMSPPEKIFYICCHC